MAITPKQFEQNCYDVLAGMRGVRLEEQGICYKYKEGKRRCPDIVGSYYSKRFVIDCKRYGPEKYIDPTDRKSLNTYVKVLQRELRWGKDDVRKIFVTTEGKGGPAKKEGFHVITVGPPDEADWETKLTDGFKKAMKKR